RKARAANLYELPSLEELWMKECRPYSSTAKANECGKGKGVNDPRKDLQDKEAYVANLKTMAMRGSSLYTGYAIVGGGASQAASYTEKLSKSCKEYFESKGQADEEVAAAMEGVRGRSTQCTHLQYVLEAGLLYSKDGQGQYPIDLLNKCPIKGNAGRAAARIRQSMYLQYAGRLGALCKKDAPIAPLGLLLAVGASSSYREAGELINQYRAARKSGNPPARPVVALARRFFGIAPEPPSVNTIPNTAGGVGVRIEVDGGGGAAGGATGGAAGGAGGAGEGVAAPLDQGAAQPGAAATTAHSDKEEEPDLALINLDVFGVEPPVQQRAPRGRQRASGLDDDLGARGGRKKQRTGAAKVAKSGRGGGSGRGEVGSGRGRGRGGRGGGRVAAVVESEEEEDGGDEEMEDDEEASGESTGEGQEDDVSVRDTSDDSSSSSGGGSSGSSGERAGGNRQQDRRQQELEQQQQRGKKQQAAVGAAKVPKAGTGSSGQSRRVRANR
ncbi:hypothetical protein Agub_g3660, partial [Astrephomene gubernaculifera]